MSKWARVIDCKVSETTMVNPEGRFVHQIEQQFMPCPAEVQAGYLYDGESYTPPVPLEADIDTVKTLKIAELDRAAATAYVAGFYSDATGVNLYYDSDEESQKLIEGLGRRATLPDWETRVRYPGTALAGFAPVRARLTASDPASTKTVHLLDTTQIAQLVADMDDHLYAIKVRLWAKQAEVEGAYQSGDSEALTAISWEV